MKRILFATLTVGLFWASSVKAQKIQDGINHLYADRYKSALKILEGIAADGKPESNYWLAQTHISVGDKAKAQQVVDNALAANTNNALLLVASGQLDLLNKKVQEARLKFETALTNSRSRRGNDAVVLNAIGKAVLDADEKSLYDFGLEKMIEAETRDAKNPDIYLNLGNAYRRFGGGKLGGEALVSYEKAIKLDNNFAVAYYRIAKLFETQKQYDFVLDNLRKAISADSQFSPAYYELFFYYFNTKKPEQAEEYLTKYIDSKKPEVYIEDQSLYASLCWYKKDYDCAITKAKQVENAMGDNVKPSVLKLLADTYVEKGDFNNAKVYVDKYFNKQPQEEVVSYDYVLKGNIYSGIPGLEDEAIKVYLAGVDADSVVENKVKLLEEVADKFKEQKKFEQEGQIREKIIAIKPAPSINDLFKTTIAYYFATNHTASRNYALMMIEKYPDQIYGYDWAVNNSTAVDTVALDSIAVPDVVKLYEFTQTDSVKYVKEYIKAVRFLAPYYINQKKDAATSLEYFIKWQEADSANAATIQGYIDQLRKIVESASGSNKGAPASGQSGGSSGAKR